MSAPVLSVGEMGSENKLAEGFKGNKFEEWSDESQ